MTHMLTLICNPNTPVLSGAHEEWARDYLSASGADVGELRKLNKHVAFELPFAGADVSARSLEEAFEDTFPDAPVDVVVVPNSNRRKTLLIADMDSTMINQECLDELADFAGLKDKISAITERAMAGELSFEPALKERVGLLAGLEESSLQRAFDERITFMSGARELVQTMKANGALTCLVSGGFTFFTARVADALGFDLHFGNTLLAENGALTGKVGEPILGKQAKLETLRRLIEEKTLESNDTLAVGDGANDQAMIEAAGLGVAYHPHKILADAADVRIQYGDLTALLYLQGYNKSEFAA